jgi:hypothetical protein
MGRMFKDEYLQEIEKRRKEWERDTLKKSLDRFGVTESPNRFYTPLDNKGFDFLEKVGFPGEYPFTAGLFPLHGLRLVRYRAEKQIRGTVAVSLRREGDSSCGLQRFSTSAGNGKA